MGFNGKTESIKTCLKRTVPKKLVCFFNNIMILKIVVFTTETVIIVSIIYYTFIYLFINLIIYIFFGT